MSSYVGPPTTTIDGVKIRLTDRALKMMERYYDRDPRRAAMACLTFGKFAGPEALGAFAASRERWLARQQAVILLIGSDFLSIEDAPRAGAGPGRRVLSSFVVPAIIEGE